jgi:hypothetical protein
MNSKNQTTVILAFIAGILLLISGISGYTTWDSIKEFVTNNILDNFIMQLTFSILIFIASLGGISVIIGGWLISKNNITTGKMFITLGAGIGFIGLMIEVIISIMQNDFTLAGFLSIGTIGIILSIIARLKIK